MNNESLVTVAIPTYNRKDMLRKAIESAINQTYKNLDILIADNHSEDGTEEMCLEYAKQDKRIRYYKHEKNLGMLFQINFISEKAIGEFFCAINDDDYISENYVESCLELIKDDPEHIFSYGTVVMVDEDYNIEKTCETFKATQDSYIERGCEYIQTGISAMLSFVFIKTDIYKQIYDYFDTYRFCEDQIVLLKSLFGLKCNCSPNAFYYKLNNGCTKDLETLKSTFNLEKMSPENYWKFLAQAHMDAILYDEFYKDKLSNQERIEFACEIYEKVKEVFSIKPAPVVIPKEKSFGQKIIDKIRGKK